MSSSVGQVNLDLGINYNGFQRQLSGIAGNATNMVGGAFKRLGGVIAGAFAVGTLVNFGREAINLASDLAEVQNVVNVTFGSMTNEINNWSSNLIDSFGLSELAGKRYASTMGAMLKSSGVSGEVMKNMSVSLTELAADMASFYNLSTDEAFYKVFSGMVGETEPLKQLGVNMSVVNMEAYAMSQGITKSWLSMTQAEQTMLRYGYLLKVTADAQGDFARNGQSWANQIRIMGEQWNIFKGTMGAGFINILTPIVRGLNWLIAKLQVAAAYFKAFTELIFGDAVNAGGAGMTAPLTDVADTAEGAAGALDDMGAATGKAGKAAKKAGKDVKGSLAGFDQLNTLSKSTAKAMSDASNSLAGAGAVGAVDLGSLTTGKLDLGIDTSQLDTFEQSLAGIKDTANNVWLTLKETFGPSIQTALNEIMPVLAGWKEQFGSMFADIKTLGAPLANWVLNDLVPLWQQGIETAGGILAGIGDSALNVVSSLWDAVFPIIDKFVTEGLPRLTEFLSGATEIFRGLFDVAKQIFDDIWRDAIDPAMQLVSGIIQDALDIIFDWWDEWGVKIIDSLKDNLDNIKKLWENIWDNFLKPFITDMLGVLKRLWDEHLKGLVKEIGTFIGKLITAASDIFNEFILPIVNWLVQKLGPTFGNVFKTIGDVIGTALGIIVDVAKGILKALGGVIDFIAGVFTGDWERAWEGIKTFFKGIWDGLVGIVKGVINIIIDLINGMIRGINKFSIDVPDWVAELAGVKGGKFGFNIPTIPRLAKGGLVSAPTLAMVGDNRNANVDPEVISPLSKLQDMLSGSNHAVVEVLLQILEVLSRSQGRDTVLQVNGTELGRLAAQGINDITRRTGQSPLTL
ncbi:hypothetical protein J40TS1_00410 [Paenibacillus montaniterrae]|uniref:Phage tail tape measure protein n=1 Tax=Paenibacillus montaniterrae TaxID=429341 RepID=A0A919YLT2_9BACL|nr:hypothetical protein [Paenibacillus montaniterrae]GIP14399.1 hypothetical protein J40TS1_00410 [Paenibacillus montaniterrae]